MLACACVQVALECRHTQGYLLYRWQFKEHRNCHARKKEDIDHMQQNFGRQAGRYEGREIADLGRLDGWEVDRACIESVTAARAPTIAISRKPVAASVGHVFHLTTTTRRDAMSIVPRYRVIHCAIGSGTTDRIVPEFRAIFPNNNL